MKKIVKFEGIFRTAPIFKSSGSPLKVRKISLKPKHHKKHTNPILFPNNFTNIFSTKFYDDSILALKMYIEMGMILIMTSQTYSRVGIRVPKKLKHLETWIRFPHHLFLLKES